MLSCTTFKVEDQPYHKFDTPYTVLTMNARTRSPNNTGIPRTLVEKKIARIFGDHDKSQDVGGKI